MKVMSIFGTRPEMIKMWGTLQKLDNQNFEHIMVHTGQNFTKELKNFFFKDLKIRKPDFNLNINTSSYGKEVSDVIYKTDTLLEKIKPNALLVLGDTYSALSVMPAANKKIKIFHMEAGLRAWDKRMPEQRNRILIDHMSDILLPFNTYHRENLIRENIHPSKIFVTGNPTFEVMREFKNEIEKSSIVEDLGLSKKEYILVTAHRSENVDDPENLESIFRALGKIQKKLRIKIIYPIHPRTFQKKKNYAEKYKIQLIKPLGFYDFNNLLKNSSCVLSDSGTAAEEGIFYGVPSVSLRKTTERPETVESGGNIISGMDLDNITESIQTAMMNIKETKYDLEKHHSPSSVVINCIRSNITNFF